MSQLSKRNWDLQRMPKKLEASFWSCRLMLEQFKWSVDKPPWLRNHCCAMQATARDEVHHKSFRTASWWTDKKRVDQTRSQESLHFFIWVMVKLSSPSPRVMKQQCLPRWLLFDSICKLLYTNITQRTEDNYELLFVKTKEAHNQ